jgi:Domain of unknown function (DUF4337)
MDHIDEHAQETIEHHGHRNQAIAVLIAALAAALALTEMGEKQAQNDYLTHHIAVSDDYAFYQAKNARATIWQVEGNILGNLPNATEAGPQTEIARAKKEESRLRDEPGGDGMKQLLEKAKQQEVARDHAYHKYHQFEYSVGALQLAIVLASVSIVIGFPIFGWTAGVIGGMAALFGLYVALV